MKKVFVVIGFAIILSAALLFIRQPVTAGTAIELSGWAWSSNTGWVNINCDDVDMCSTSDYKLVMDSVSGELSGYGWSSNIGWVSFNPSDLTGCPSAPCIGMFDPSTGEASGWARALSHGDGWDGWIKLGDIISGVSSYGISESAGDWEGFAWGSSVIGWLHAEFSEKVPILPLIVGGCVGAPDPADIDEVVTWSCVVGGGTAPYTYVWSGTDGLSGSTNPITKMYSATGTKSALLDVTDNAGMTGSGSAFIEVEVPADGTVKEVIP